MDRIQNVLPNDYNMLLNIVFCSVTLCLKKAYMILSTIYLPESNLSKDVKVSLIYIFSYMVVQQQEVAKLHLIFTFDVWYIFE